MGLITENEYIAALAVVRAYERQIVAMADSNIFPGKIIAAPDEWWIKDHIDEIFDFRPCTYESLRRAGFEEEDISSNYEVVGGPFSGYLVPKNCVQKLHKDDA